MTVERISSTGDPARAVAVTVEQTGGSELELPGGLKIVGRQVDAGLKKIDFQLQNAAGAQSQARGESMEREELEAGA